MVGTTCSRRESIRSGCEVRSTKKLRRAFFSHFHQPPPTRVREPHEPFEVRSRAITYCARVRHERVKSRVSRVSERRNMKRNADAMNGVDTMPRNSPAGNLGLLIRFIDASLSNPSLTKDVIMKTLRDEFTQRLKWGASECSMWTAAHGPVWSIMHSDAYRGVALKMVKIQNSAKVREHTLSPCLSPCSF